MPRPLKQGILGASTIVISKDIDKYAFMCGSNFNETGVNSCHTYQRQDNIRIWKILPPSFTI